MANLQGTFLLSVATIVVYAMTAEAQQSGTSEPPAKIVIDPPLAEPLASRGVVVIQYYAENLTIVPVFGPNAPAVSPVRDEFYHPRGEGGGVERIGHIHVTVDDASWHWVDASGAPIILRGLRPGPHKVLLELADPTHRVITGQMVEFTVPAPKEVRP